MLPLIDFFLGADDGLIESENCHDDDKPRQSTDATEQWREIDHGDKRKNKFRQRMQVHKATIKKTFQCLVRFPDPIDGSATMMGLMPFYGNVQCLMVPLLQKIAAKIEGKLPFHDARRAMERPFNKFQPKINKGIKPCIMQYMHRIIQYFIDKPSQQNRIGGISEI